MLNQQTNEDPRAKIAAFHQKQEAERQELEQLQRDAAALEAAEQLQRQQEAERAILEARRQERLTLEADQALTKGERQQVDNHYGPQAAQALADQTLKEYIAQFNRKNAAQREGELIAWRDSHPGSTSPGQRTEAFAQADKNAHDRALAFSKMIEDTELRAERYDNPTERIIYSLPEEARSIMLELANKHPDRLTVIQQVQQQNAQQGNEQRQIELETQFRAEAQKVRGSPVWSANIRAKYVSLGWDGIQRLPV
jgi:hypothetical protein